VALSAIEAFSERELATFRQFSVAVIRNGKAECMKKEKVIFLASLLSAIPTKLAFEPPWPGRSDVNEDLKLNEIRKSCLMNFNGIIHGDGE